MTEERLLEITEILLSDKTYEYDWAIRKTVALELLKNHDALAAELDDWRSGKLRLAPLKAAAAATNTHKEDLR